MPHNAYSVWTFWSIILMLDARAQVTGMSTCALSMLQATHDTWDLKFVEYVPSELTTRASLIYRKVPALKGCTDDRGTSSFRRHPCISSYLLVHYELPWEGDETGELDSTSKTSGPIPFLLKIRCSETKEIVCFQACKPFHSAYCTLFHRDRHQKRNRKDKMVQ